MKTLADELRDENEALRRRFVHHTRPKEPMTLEEAIALCERMGTDITSSAADGEAVSEKK